MFTEAFKRDHHQAAADSNIFEIAAADTKIIEIKYEYW
jgi:hypothetical protein